MSVCERMNGLGVEVNSFVNYACEKLLFETLTGEVLEQFRIEVEIEHLRVEERNLRQDLALILRNGAYLEDYAKKLLVGDRDEVSMLQHRRGIYSQVDSKELDIILRILFRREAIAKRLVELMDKTLPKERYPFGLTEKGWKINPKGGEKA